MSCGCVSIGRFAASTVTLEGLLAAYLDVQSLHIFVYTRGVTVLGWWFQFLSRLCRARRGLIQAHRFNFADTQYIILSIRTRKYFETRLNVLLP